jgi:hypothetical protein
MRHGLIQLKQRGIEFSPPPNGVHDRRVSANSNRTGPCAAVSAMRRIADSQTKEAHITGSCPMPDEAL